MQKLNSKYIIDLNAKLKTIKCLKDNIGKNVCDLAVAKYSLNEILKAYFIKENN